MIISPLWQSNPIFHPPAGRGIFDGIVDKVGDRLDQEVAVTINAYFVRRLNDKADPPLSSAIGSYMSPHLAHQVCERDFAEAKPIADFFLDFRKPQESPVMIEKRLIERLYRFVCKRPAAAPVFWRRCDRRAQAPAGPG